MHLSLIFLGVALPLLAASPIAVPILPRQGSDTRNDLTNGTPCKALTILFARGTGETGNVGALTGPPFFSAVAAKIGTSNVAVQGIDYPADIPGFLEGGDPRGSALMAQLVGTVQKKCPATKLVLSGYSQGGQLVHNAAKELSASTAAFVNSVVIFGDPDASQPVASIPASKVKIICHPGDNICQGGDLILPAHITYAVDAGSAAAFVVGQAAL